MTNENFEFSVKIEVMPTEDIVYMRRTGAYGPENAALMERFKAWVSKNDLFDDESVILGVALDNPETTPPQSCRYDTCLLVKSGFECESEGVLKRELSGGKYAVLKLQHTAAAVATVWSDGIPKLLKEGYSLDAKRPIIERYQKRLVDQGFCEFCVPIL